MKKLFNGIYFKRKVFITGHTGFKGTWLTLWLNELGAKVTGFALKPNTKPSHYILSEIGNNIKSNISDIRKLPLLKNAIANAKPEIVFHLAAQPIVKTSYENPLLTYETNIMGLVNLFEAIKDVKSVKAVVIITSDKCYENKEWEWGYRETDELGGADPYSSSKACAEIITNAYYRSLFKGKIEIATARAGNVIGGGDWSKYRIVPDCIRAIQSNIPIVLRNPESTRPWQHVLEPLSGYLLLGAKLFLRKEILYGGFNFGPMLENEISVLELVKMIYKALKIKPNIILKGDKLQHESKLLQLDISKTRNVLKWLPVWNSYEAISKTTEWYKSYYSLSRKSKELSIKHIYEYADKAKQKKLYWAL